MTDLFENSDYSDNSKTQEKQGEILINKTVNKSPENVSTILDIGCGDGKLTKKLSNIYEDSEIIGIDSSKNQIKDCPNIKNVSFKNKKFPNCTFNNEKFDIIFSNAAMHWIDNQLETYKKIENLLSDNGKVFIHQGHKGCYSELKEVARNLIETDFDIKLNNWEYPINYHNRESIKNIIDETELKFEEIEVIHSDLSETIVDDFSEAGLNNFKQLLENDKDKKIFTEKFKKKANNISIDNINSKRLYFVLY